MIENYLLIPVKNVKKQTLLGFLCVVLVGCDNAKGLVSFTPEMASFSNEFDFDPLRGPVKDFSQTLLNSDIICCPKVMRKASTDHQRQIFSLHFHP